MLGACHLEEEVDLDVATNKADGIIRCELGAIRGHHNYPMSSRAECNVVKNIEVRRWACPMATMQSIVPDWDSGRPWPERDSMGPRWLGDGSNMIKCPDC